MKSKALIAVLLASFVAPGCAAITPVEDNLLGCVTNLAAEEVGRLAPQVREVLRNQGEGWDWRGQLTELALGNGLEAVRCIVASLAVEAMAQVTTTKSAGAMANKAYLAQQDLVAERARVWLDETSKERPDACPVARSKSSSTTAVPPSCDASTDCRCRASRPSSSSSPATSR